MCFPGHSHFLHPQRAWAPGELRQWGGVWVGGLLSAVIYISGAVDCCIIKRRCRQFGMHVSPARCISTEFISVTAESGFMLVRFFNFFYKPLGSGSHSKQFRGRKDYRRTLLFTESSEEIVQFLTKDLGLPGSPSSENGESQPKRHRNQDLPSSQDVKPSKEAETSQRERQGPSGNTDHSHAHTRAICPALGAS